jgi:hypothetical protein
MFAALEHHHETSFKWKSMPEIWGVRAAFDIFHSPTKLITNFQIGQASNPAFPKYL